MVRDKLFGFRTEGQICKDDIASLSKESAREMEIDAFRQISFGQIGMSLKDLRRGYQSQHRLRLQSCLPVIRPLRSKRRILIL